MSEYKITIKDSKRQQLNDLKGSLEDLELYLREIEHTLEVFDSSPDEESKAKCRLEMARIQQQILEISKRILTEQKPTQSN